MSFLRPALSIPGQPTTRNFLAQHPLFIPFQHSHAHAYAHTQIRHYSPSHDHQITATRSTIAQLLNHIDSHHTANQYLTHFASTHSPAHPFAVIKVGGAILTSHLQTLTSTLALFSRVGLYPVIVHGAGPQLNQILEDAGVEPRFEDGIRVTDGQTLAIARRLFLEENLKLVQALEGAGVAARPITAGVLRAEYLDRERYGFVGRVREVEKAGIMSAVRAACLPVLTSMAETGDGQVLNVNADVAAVELARALKPKKVVYLAEKGGLMHGVTGRMIERINLAEEYDDLMAQKWVKYGTRLKIKAVSELLRDLPGMESVSIVHPVDLQREVFVASGAGTRIERGTRILSTTSAEFRDEGRLVKALRKQGAGEDEVRFCVQEMRSNRPFKVYFQDPASMSPLAVVSFGYGSAPRLITFPNRSVESDAVADDMFLRITKDFPKLVWNVPENDDRLDWFSARATGRFHYGGWAMLRMLISRRLQATVSMDTLLRDDVDPVRHSVSTQVDLVGSWMVANFVSLLIACCLWLRSTPVDHIGPAVSLCLVLFRDAALLTCHQKLSNQADQEKRQLAEEGSRPE